MIETSVSKIVYENEENGFKIVKLAVLNPDVLPSFAQNSSHTITAKGYFPVNKFIRLKVDGQWEKSKYGYQLNVETFEEIIPQTKEGIIAYLSSGLICGIGKKTAEKIVKQFGLDTLRVMDNTPERLLEVRGVSRKKLDKIISSYKNSRIAQQIVSYLVPLGITPNKCIKIVNEFADSSMDVLLNEPFRLCEISGFGFDTVDRIARKTTFKMNDVLRIKAGIKYLLEYSAAAEGHMCIDQRELLIESYMLLNCTDVKYQTVCEYLKSHTTDTLSVLIGKEYVTFKEVVSAFKEMAFDGTLNGDNGMAYLAGKYNQEVETARLFATRLTLSKNSSKKISNEAIEEEIENAEKRNKISLASQQKEAIKMGVLENTCIITGGPGTGKTTVLKLVLETCEKFMNIGPSDVTLLAPTGRAASRMCESVGDEYTASTIHSALHIQDETNCAECDTLDTSIVVVDEVSMMDSFIAWRLLKAVPLSTKLILIGDAEQLPSVGAGNVLFELLNSKAIPYVKLETIYRQSGISPVALNDDLIRKGITNLRFSDEFKLIEISDYEKSDKDRSKKIQEETSNVIIKEYLEAVQSDGIDNVQVLCPIRKKGIIAGATELNKAIQSVINPPDEGKKEVKRGECVLRVGDKVIQTKNNYAISWAKDNGEIGEGIYNGDCGYIEDIDDDELTINFNGKKAIFDISQISDIDLAYAISIHKSQGSEYKTCIIPMLTAFAIMLKRNLIHTGVSRAKKRIVIVGQKRAIDMAIRNNSISKRNTLLAYRINKILENER